MYSDLPSGTHLVIDATTIADTYRLCRRVHQPQRSPTEPIFLAEEPWEGTSVTPLHVLHDADTGRWRMWYQAHDQSLTIARKALKRTTNGNVGEPQPMYCCYAESSDGIHWERPNLGIYGDTNIVFKGVSECCGNTFLYRPDAPADRRYALVNCEWHTEQVGGIFTAYSADGLHWRYEPETPVIFGDSDTWNCIVWNPERQVYMLYMRAWHSAAINWPDLGKGNSRRRVGYAESRDLVNWTEPQVIISPDELDSNDIYGLQVFRHADYWLGYLWIYDEDDVDSIEVELIWSHDGIRWQRLPERQLFLPRGTDYMVIPSQQPTIAGDDTWIYYTTHPGPHNHRFGTVESRGYRARLRTDGFISLDAESQLGAAITRPFTLDSDRITINVSAPYGEVVAELVEPWEREPAGRPIAGFAAADFDVFRGDDTAHVLTWRGSSDLSALRGRRLLLRLQLHYAQLYSFTL